MDLDFDKEIQNITKQLIEKYGPEKIILDELLRNILDFFVEV